MNGQDLVNKAQTKLGDAYILGSMAPKNDADYNGPWDCAELVSWAVFQTIGKLYGCENDEATSAANADAGTVYWARDVNNKKVRSVSIDIARATPGAILLREAGDGLDGHIVISRGDGSTIEAMGTKWGVVNGKVDGRRWATGILLNEITYTSNSIQPHEGVMALHIGADNDPAKVVAVQSALINKGYDLANPDGIYGPKTMAAVRDFQIKEGLTPDGEVGPQTKSALGL